MTRAYRLRASCRCGKSTCFRSEPRTRWVTRTTYVSDGSCSTGRAQLPLKDGVHLIQYDFFAPGHCTVRCFRQWVQPDGSFTNGACEAPPPAVSTAG